jgi:hypothetical protein
MLRIHSSSHIQLLACTVSRLGNGCSMGICDQVLMEVNGLMEVVEIW